MLYSLEQGYEAAHNTKVTRLTLIRLKKTKKAGRSGGKTERGFHSRRVSSKLQREPRLNHT